MAKYNSRRSQEQWLQLITDCRQSGLADNVWCEQNNVPPSSFYNAVTRIRKKACAIPETSVPSDSTYALDFTSRQEVVRVDLCPDPSPQPVSPCIDVPEPATPLNNSHTIELMMDNFRVKISNAADPGLLAEILRILKGQSC